MLQLTVELNDLPDLTSRAARRVLVNPETLKSLKLSTGDVVAVSKNDVHLGKLNRFAVGAAWSSSEISPQAVSMSSNLLCTADLTPEDPVYIYPLSQSKAAYGLPAVRNIQEAHVVGLEEEMLVATSRATSKGRSDSRLLKQLLRECLVNLKYITNSQRLRVDFEGTSRQFQTIHATPRSAQSDDPVKTLTHKIDSLGLTSSPSLWTFGWESEVELVDPMTAEVNCGNVPEGHDHLHHLEPGTNEDPYATIGGLNKQISQIRDLLELPLTQPHLFRSLGLKPPRGILLHGPPGTGKTHLARAIASSTKSSVLVINGPELSSAYHGETEAKLRDVFQEAYEKKPCIVVLDEVDALVPKREDGGGNEVEKRVVATLLTILDGMQGEEGKGQEGVVIVGTTNRPNAIDPALRRPGRFDREIEIGIPDVEARLSILQILLSRTSHQITDEDLRTFASRAHGYVGADLTAVVREAGTIAIKRWLVSNPNDSTSTRPTLALTIDDLNVSLTSVRPSAMRSLFVDAPRVSYSEIGGQKTVIQKLREAVEWPLLHSETFKRLGVRPPKGLLLYGPPGCSKTVLARACACESGVNFLAVKGPELLNKFVGESERAVREIFRKARAASPSIIFFDEIDALATSRTSSDSDSGASHEGVLTSLLNEMDGVQELVGVTVIAATNRPEVLDSALMRPGRLDRILYVGPPDQHAREEILQIRTKTMAVDPKLDIKLLAEMCDGCSGAEISSACQEAAIHAMRKDIQAQNVPAESFIEAVRHIKRQITPEVLMRFERWTDGVSRTAAL